MNDTTTQTISEADVAAFFSAMSTKYAGLFPELESLDVGHGAAGFSFFGFYKVRPDVGPSYVSIHGKSLQECAESLRQEIGSPETKAQKLREEAAKLIAKADALQPA